MARSEKEDTGQVKEEIAEKAGKYLAFVLGVEMYGLEILKVQEIIGLINITKVPRTPDFIRGVINLRGKVIPVMDLREKFGLESREDTERTCIIVVQVEERSQKATMGILVDEVSEVLDIKADSMEPPPSFGMNVDTDFIMCIGKIEDMVIMLLDIDRVLEKNETRVSQQLSVG
jgi:purine-binding chemotaxis protein CheW